VQLDKEYSKGMIYGTRIVNSLCILDLVTGITVPDTTRGTTFGNLGVEKTAFPKSAFHGGTVHERTEILDRRDSKSHMDSGTVFWRHTDPNHDQEFICSCVDVPLRRDVLDDQRVLTPVDAISVVRHLQT
jgi:acyl dehydratase